MRTASLRSFLAVVGFRTVLAQYAFTAPEPAVANFDSVNDVTQGTVYNLVWIANSKFAQLGGNVWR